MAVQGQGLTDDVLWHVSTHLDSARDIMNLAIASTSIWQMNRTQLYQFEVAQARDAGPGSHHSRIAAIHTSIKRGHNLTTTSLVQAALNLWPDYLDVRCPSGLTPIQLAAATGNVHIAQSLHSAGCDLNAEVYLSRGSFLIFNNRRNLPMLSSLFDHQLFHHHDRAERVDSLALAIEHNQPDAVRYLLQHMDLDRPSLPNQGRISPLHLAALAGNLDTVEALLELDHPLETSRLHANAAKRETALHYAAAHNGNNTAVIQTLLAHGASLGTTAMNGKTALEVAFWNKVSPANAKFLLDYSINNNDLQACNWDATFIRATECPHMLHAIHALLKDTDAISEELLQSRLRYLIANGRENMTPTVICLIEKLYPIGQQHTGYILPWDSCDINSPDFPIRAPETVLQAAIAKPGLDQRYFRMILHLRDWDLEAADVKGRTAFRYAMYHRQYSAALMLMERNAEWKFPTTKAKEAMLRWLRNQHNTEDRPAYWAARLEQDLANSRPKLRKRAPKRQR
ncbi:hypothetical protein PG989_002830 [Apiospora arundinis]